MHNSYPLLICTWFLKNPVLKNLVALDELFVFYKLDCYCLCSLQKSSSNYEKNPVHQTGNFTLENLKNPVQIDRGSGPYLPSLTVYTPWYVFITFLLLWYAYWPPIYLHLIFEKSSLNWKKHPVVFKLGKDPVYQTQYFKLENWSNLVQIDRG